MSLSDKFPNYFPYCDWKRNHGAMHNTKLRNVLHDYEVSEARGYTTDAVERVMANGGDLDDNYRHARGEAQKRGLLVR